MGLNHPRAFRARHGLALITAPKILWDLLRIADKALDIVGSVLGIGASVFDRIRIEIG